MTADRWAEIDRLYHAALERDATERTAFLREACGADEALLREVQSLLAYEPSSAEFLERPALEEAAKDLAADAGPSLVEKQIAGYRVLSLLGEGGMGEVYRARDVRLDREVALKVLAREIAGDPGYVRRFEEEARSASGLNHPNIVTIYGVGEEGEVAYIAMELVQGRTLREVLEGGAISVVAALDLAVPLADALAAAHGAGIVHRDLKPENVMVTPDGVVKVLDFGIAKRRPRVSSSGPAEERDGTIAGTVGYMSPEQAAGQPADPASDQFSFGAILYEMLSGRPAFERSTHRVTLAAIVHEEPEPLHNVVTGVPVALRKVITRCLAKDPRDRYADSRHLATELRRIRDASGLTRRRAIRVAAATAAAAVAGLAFWRLSPRRARLGSLAVLPFANPTADEDAEYICDGIAESLIRRLSLLPALRVIAFSTVRNFKGKSADPRAAGRRLGVEAVLGGAVTRRGGRVRITAELVEIASGSRLWGNEFDRPEADMLSVQDEIAGAIISEGIPLPMTAAERLRFSRNLTDDAEAYSLFLRAVHHFRLQTEDGYLLARDLLTAAVSRDPEFALAHVTLASTYSVMAIDGYERPTSAWPQSGRHVARALAVDSDLPDAHAEAASREFFYHRNWAAAQREWEAALRSRRGEVQPELLSAYALQQWAIGRTAAALEFARAARSIDPLSAMLAVREADLLAMTNRLDEAALLYEKVIRDTPGDHRAYFGLADVRRLQGRFEEAIEVRRRVHAAGEDAALETLFSTARGAEGYRRIELQTARLLLDMLSSREAAGGYVSPLEIARVHARLGDEERAFRYLDAAFAERSPGLVFLKVDRAWDALRDDPRFLGAVRRVGLPG